MKYQGKEVRHLNGKDTEPREFERGSEQGNFISCHNCRYLGFFDEKEICYRHAPMPNLIKWESIKEPGRWVEEAFRMAIWPEVQRCFDSCGDFEPDPRCFDLSRKEADNE